MTIEKIAIDLNDPAAWLELRRPNVNASEVATVLGLGAFGSLAELYAEKKGLRPGPSGHLLRRGKWLEPAVFEALADQRPEWRVQRAAIYLVDRQHKLGATPDGFALAPDRNGRGVIQAKVISRTVFRRRWLIDESASIEDGDAEPPIYYVLQVLTEMMLADAEWGVLAVLVASEFDASLRLFDIERDIEQEVLIHTGVARFHRDYLTPGIMPPFEPQADADLIKALYPRADGSVIDLTASNAVGGLVDQLTELKAASSRIDKDEKAVKAELQAMLGENTYGQLADGRVLCWKNQPRRGYTVAPSNPRVLRILKQMPASVGHDDEEEE